MVFHSFHFLFAHDTPAYSHVSNKDIPEKLNRSYATSKRQLTIHLPTSFVLAS